MHMTKLGNILNALFDPYFESVPEAKKISTAMIQKGIIQHQSDIVNDHIAFRTLGVPNLGINSLEKIFLHYGYEKKDYYFFEKKKLDAYWYAPPSPNYPRIFVSELRVNDLSNTATKIINEYIKDIIVDPVSLLNLDNVEDVASFFYKPLWKVPQLEDYKILLKESEYAAWVLYNRYYLNHYTISVHDLPSTHNTIEKFNDFVESIGITLNTAGGKIKISKDGLLKQSSTIAEVLSASFAGGEHAKISSSYVEFAERLPLPNIKGSKREQRRDGFESSNADKIFESTYTKQTNKTK